MCAVVSKPFYDIPYLPRKMILDSMSPFEVLTLSLSSSKTYDMLCWMKLKAKFDLTVTKEHVIITARTIHGVESKMYVGRTNEKATSTFNCIFDREYFSGCQTTAAGYVYPYGLDAILGRLFRIFSTSHIDSVNIEKKFGTSDEDFTSFTRAIDNLVNKPKGLPINHLIVFTHRDVDECEPIKKIASLLGKEPEKKPAPKETSFPVDHYLHMGLQTISIPSSTLHDGVFNRIILKWCSSRNTHLRNISIHTDEMSRHDDLLRGLPPFKRNRRIGFREGVFYTYTIQRPTDKRKATITRNDHEFTFSVESVPSRVFEDQDADLEDNLDDDSDSDDAW